MATRYGGQSGVSYIRQENAGVARARNRGLELARGDAVAFLDSDDTWRPWKLAFQLACLERAPGAGMIWTELTAVDAAGELRSGSSLRDVLPFRFALDELFRERIPLGDLPGVPVELKDHNLYVGDIYAKMVLGNLVLPSSALITRARLDKVQRFDESLQVAGEDFEFFLRVCGAGDVAFADVPSVVYQVGRADQLTHASKSRHLARNYLRTLEAALIRDPERIDRLSAPVREARAHGYAWVGQTLLEAGEVPAARHHLRRSLRFRPTSFRALTLTALAMLPASVLARTLSGVRWLLGHLPFRASAG